jgi:hypothetical protein
VLNNLEYLIADSVAVFVVPLLVLELVEIFVVVFVPLQEQVQVQ